MLQDYLRVAQHSLSAHRQLYLVKEQRLALALDHYTHLNHAYKATSRTSRESLSHTHTHTHTHTHHSYMSRSWTHTHRQTLSVINLWSSVLFSVIKLVFQHQV